MATSSQHNINFKVNSSGTEEVYDKIRRMSQDLAREVVRDTLSVLEEGEKASKELGRKLSQKIGTRRVERDETEYNIRAEYDRKILERREQFEKWQQEGRRPRAAIQRERIQMEGDISEIEKEKVKELREEKQNFDAEERLLKEIIETLRNNAQDEAQRDKDNTRDKIEQYQRGQYTPATEEEKLKLEIQREIVGGGGGGKGGTTGVSEQEKSNFWQDIGRGFRERIGHRALDTLLMMGGQMATAQTEEYSESSLFRIIPLIGDTLEAAQNRHLRERDQRMGAYYGVRGVTGQGNLFYGANYGFSADQMTEFARALAETRGTRENLGEDTTDIVALSKALGLNMQQMIQTSIFEVMGGGSTLYRVRSLTGALGITEDSDRSRLGIMLEAQNQLLSQQSQILERVSTPGVSSTMGAFSQIGGSFADMRMAERISRINQGLANPSNPYQAASNYAILSSMVPGSSFYELKEKEERGVYEPEFLKSTLDYYTKVYGQGELGMEAVRRRFGLSYSQGRQFFDAYQQNPNIFDNIGGETTIEGLFTQGDIRRMGAANTTQTDRSVALINDAFAESLVTGITTQFELLLKEVKKDLSGLFNTVGEEIKGSGDWGGVGKQIGIGMLGALVPGAGISQLLGKRE